MCKHHAARRPESYPPTLEQTCWMEWPAWGLFPDGKAALSAFVGLCPGAVSAASSHPGNGVWLPTCKGPLTVPFSSQVLSAVCSGKEEEEVRKRRTPGPEEHVNTSLHSRRNILSSF